MRPIVTDRVASSVCRSVRHSSEPCKNGWTDQDAVWVEDSGVPQEPCVRWSPDPPTKRGILKEKSISEYISVILISHILIVSANKVWHQIFANVKDLWHIWTIKQTVQTICNRMFNLHYFDLLWICICCRFLVVLRCLTSYVLFIGSLLWSVLWLAAALQQVYNKSKSKLHWFDLLLICCGLVVQLSACCRFAVDFVVQLVVCNKCTTNRNNGVWDNLGNVD